MKSAASFLALSCVGFIATAPAMAEDAPTATVTSDDVQDRDILVEGERLRNDNPKIVAPLADTPRSIVVLLKEVIEQTGSSTLQDALRTVPGITFGAAEGGNPVGDRPFIRGFDSQNSIYVDGVRDIGAQSREVFAIENVQIVRGSDSTLGGRGGAGGSINIITKLPTNENFVAGAVSYGTDDYKRVTADVNQRVSDMVTVRVAGVWHDQDIAGRDALWQKRWGVAPSITLGLGTPTRLTVGYYHLETDELPDSGIPYLYTIGNAPLGATLSKPAVGQVTTITGVTGDVDRSAFYGLAARDFRETQVDQATMRAEHDFGAVTLRNTSRFSHTSQSYIFAQPDDQQGNVFGTATAPGGQVWRRANTRYGYTESVINQTDLFGTLRTGGIEHSFAVGAEFAWEKARRGAFVLATGATVSPRCSALNLARFNCTSLFNPNPSDPWVNYASDAANAAALPIAQQQPIQETQNDARTQAVYAFDSITLTPALILNLGARFDRFTSRLRPGQPVTATTAIAFERTDELFNWQAGLVFKPTGTTSLYASYATSATPPNSLLGEGQEANALPTTITPDTIALLDSLKPEKSRSYEVGAKAEMLGGRLLLTAAAFQTETDNARVTGPGGVAEFVGERRIRGVELSATGTILPGWTVFGGYTHLDPKIVDGGFTALTAPAAFGRPAATALVPSINTGRQATQTARNTLSIWTNATVFDRLTLGGGAFYVSRVYGGYQDNRSAVQDAAGTVTVVPATRTILRSIDGYWRFDARAGFRFNERVELSVNVQNLTDKTYFNQAFAAHYASIAPGRQAFATLSLRY